MPLARRGVRMWGLPVCAVALVLGACGRSIAEEQTAPPTRAPEAKADSSPKKDGHHKHHPRREAQPGATAAPSARSAPTDTTAQTTATPDEEAPALGGPSGPFFESGTPDAAPRSGDRGEPAPDVEAPALGGPSGGEQRPAGEGAGRYAPWWTRVPNVQPFPPPGDTIVPPRGDGYYTLLELIRGDRRDRPPRYPYPRFGVIQFSYYNADWRYLDDADARDRDPFDFLKRVRFDDWMFTTGGEVRYRYNNEVDSRVSGRDNVYQTTRTRVYGDLWYRDNFRIFAELINAQSFDQDLPPGAGDQYNPNFLNLFADLKLGTLFDRPLWLRGGRQELLYGSQRLISPLDWANTRRTFQGVKMFWQNDKLSLDGFVVQPVTPSANSFASVNWQQVFSGVWGTYRPVKGEVVDLYYLDLQDSNLIYSGRGGVKGAQNVSTVGSRWYGDRNGWLWDTEAMLQFGRYSNQGIFAKAYTMGGGHYFRDVRFNPTIWLYYDYASGDPDPGANSVHRTFNQLFPFGHYYFGMMDLVGRQNINDVHADLSFFPTKWWTTWVQYHVLRLDSPRDALYNSSGAVVRQDLTGRSGTDVGEILTVINNFTIDLHQNVFVQYSHLYAGDYLRKTGSGRSPDYLYFMYSFRW